jgi:hypothetical protein
MLFPSYSILRWRLITRCLLWVGCRSTELKWWRLSSDPLCMGQFTLFGSIHLPRTWRDTPFSAFTNCAHLSWVSSGFCRMQELSAIRTWLAPLWLSTLALLLSSWITSRVLPTMSRSLLLCNIIIIHISFLTLASRWWNLILMPWGGNRPVLHGMTIEKLPTRT